MEKKTILIVDDEILNLRTTAEILKSYYHILIANSAASALSILETATPNLILLDIMMPGMDGFLFVDEMHRRFPSKQIYIIFLSAANTQESVKKSLEKGAYGYILKPSDPQILKSKISRVFFKAEKTEMESIYSDGKRIMDIFFSGEKKLLTPQMISEWAHHLVDQVEHCSGCLMSILPFFENEDDDSAHNVKVAMLSAILGHTLNLTNLQLIDLTIAGLLHDSGKIYIPKEIVGKPSYLNAEEFEKIEEHPILSYKVAKELGIQKVQILNAILCHHEKLDGTGYPNGLISNAIPLFAQILSICDVFDALTTNRPYRTNYTTFEALKIMQNDMSDQFNISILSKFMALLVIRKK